MSELLLWDEDQPSPPFSLQYPENPLLWPHSPVGAKETPPGVVLRLKMKKSDMWCSWSEIIDEQCFVPTVINYKSHLLEKKKYTVQMPFCVNDGQFLWSDQSFLFLSLFLCIFCFILDLHTANLILSVCWLWELVGYRIQKCFLSRALKHQAAVSQSSGSKLQMSAYSQFCEDLVRTTQNSL